jgi:hypothetical protein
VLSFGPSQTGIMEPTRRSDAEAVYATSAREFVLSSITVSSETPFDAPADHSVEILFSALDRIVGAFTDQDEARTARPAA